MTTEQQAYEEWFLNHARAPIDPWHKEFARAVWQASRAALKQELLSEEVVELVVNGIKEACYIVESQHYEHPFVYTDNGDGSGYLSKDTSKPKVLHNEIVRSLDDGMATKAAKAAFKAIAEKL